MKSLKDELAEKLKILLVEGNAISRKVFVGMLKDTQIQIDEADCKKQGLKMLHENKYDMIFLDEMIVKMNDIRDFMNENIPVILMTSNEISKEKYGYSHEKFSGFLKKPIKIAELNKIISSFSEQYVIEKKSVSKQTPMIDGLDWNYAKIHFPSEEDIYDFLPRFYSLIEADAKELESYFENIKDESFRKNFQTKVHSMKNSAATIGIIPLAGMAKVLEDAAKNKEYSVLEPMTPIFLSKWRGYKERLQEYGKKESDLKPAKEHMDEISGLLEKIRFAAEEMDMDELDRLSEILEQYRFEGEWKEKIEKIGVAIQKFDIEYLSSITY